MPHPSIDYTCPHCGAVQTLTFRIVPEAPVDPAASAPPREIPSIDLSCRRCGAFTPFKIVPESVRAFADAE